MYKLVVHEQQYSSNCLKPENGEQRKWWRCQVKEYIQKEEKEWIQVQEAIEEWRGLCHKNTSWWKCPADSEDVMEFS